MATSTDTTKTVRNALADHPDTIANELAEVTGLGRSTVSRALAGLEEKQKATRTAGGRDGGRKQPDAWALIAASAAVARNGANVDGSRLGKGELRTLVLEHLQKAPGQDHGPTQVVKALGRSSGAVGNALARLTEDGTVTQTSDKPRRFAYHA